MPTFSYTARTANGQLKSDTLDAANRDDAIANLRRQRLTVVKIDENASKKKRMGNIGMRDIVISSSMAPVCAGAAHHACAGDARSRALP